jgi:hypothetical protein
LKTCYQELRERLDREETRADGNWDAYEKVRVDNRNLIAQIVELNDELEHLNQEKAALLANSVGSDGSGDWKAAFEQEYKVSGERGREIIRLKAEIQELRLSRLIDGLEILKFVDQPTYELAIQKIKPLVESWSVKLGASNASAD